MMTRKKTNSVTVNDDVSRKKLTIKKLRKLPTSPPIENISDLIRISKSLKLYNNIDTLMLWRVSPHLESLQSMVGMESLKETVFYQTIYYLQNMHTRNQNEEYLHTIICGEPGTGKTTVARILGNIYKSIGVLSPNGKFKIAYRDDFIAEYLGQTANKTRKLLESCIGGVLFIDEVYSLAPRSSDRDSFSDEALDTLTSFLSEHKNDFCCIAAGYEDDIFNRIFTKNKGLERRFPWVHKIQKYTTEDLANIMLKMIEDINWDTGMERSDVIQFMEDHKEHFKRAGGDIETFLSKCKMVHAKRVLCLRDEHRFVLTLGDMRNAINMIEKQKGDLDTDLGSEPPYGMYV